MEWKLTFTALRHDYSNATEANMENRVTHEFTQTADAKFTVECLDILLVDPTVTKISLTPVPQS